jgi:hypothetical protein
MSYTREDDRTLAEQGNERIGEYTFDLSLIVNGSPNETLSTVVSGDSVTLLFFYSLAIFYFLSYESQPQTTMKSRYSAVTSPIVSCHVHNMIQS